MKKHLDGLCVLMKEHARLEELLHSLEKIEKQESTAHIFSGDKDRILKDMDHLLAIHDVAETRVLQTEVQKAELLQDACEICRECIRDEEECLAAIRNLLKSTDSSSPFADFRNNLKLASQALKRHIFLEETELFPRMREVLEKKELEDLGNKVEKVEAEEEQQEVGIGNEKLGRSQIVEGVLSFNNQALIAHCL